MQNLTADHFVSSAYLRAHFRKEKGLPILVEKIVDASPTISHTSIIALRNLAVDLKNKELIGKYGMREVCSHIPDAKQVHSHIVHTGFPGRNNLIFLRPDPCVLDNHAKSCVQYDSHSNTLLRVILRRRLRSPRYFWPKF